MTVAGGETTETYDVIVVGGGNAALCAALTAREEGANVLLLECAPEEERGGNSSFTEGLMRFVYNGSEDIRALSPDLTPDELASDFGAYTEEKFFDDNAERMVFFCKATMETVKKFGWHPNIIHCHGWMTSLIPLYLKTQYAKDPVFAHTKMVYSVYEKSFSDKLNKNFLKTALIGEDIKEKDLAVFKELTNEAITLGGAQYADAIVQGTENIENMAAIKKVIGKKPFLEYQDLDNMTVKYAEFYQSLL